MGPPARAARSGDAEDEAFVRVMDLADDYLGREERVCTAFSRGFLRLAEARLAMGADRVCVESVPKAHLRATSSVAVSRAGALRFVPGLAPKREAKKVSEKKAEAGGSTGGAEEKPEAGGDAKGDGEKAEAGGDAEGAVEEPVSEIGFGGRGPKTAGTEDAAEKPELTSIVDQLVAKYCPEELEVGEEEEEEENDDDDESEEEKEGDGEEDDGGEGKEGGDSGSVRARRRRASGRRRGDPLAWFGTVVPPSLREAQREFASAVAAAVAAAEARSKLLRALEDATGQRDA